MFSIPLFPESVELKIDLQEKLKPVFDGLPDGISELTFFSLLIHSAKYNYRIAATQNGGYVLLREKNGGKYFVPLKNFPDGETLEKLLHSGCKPALLAERQVAEFAPVLSKHGLQLAANRDDADYVYSRRELAELRSKAFHKKKNHLNSFLKNYTPCVELLSEGNAQVALSVLERWNQSRAADYSDYNEAKAALQLLPDAPFWGIVVFVEGEPAGFSLGEFMLGGKMFCTHFEKGVESFGGIYQYLNQKTAELLPPSVELINREQDLGDEGLRQSKLTYRPVRFIEKYQA